MSNKFHRTSCPSKTLWLISSFAAALFTFCYLLSPLWNYHLRQVLPTESPCQIQSSNKIVILYWTKYFGANDFGFGIGKKSFAQCDPTCSHSCRTTTDRNLLNKSDVTSAIPFQIDLKMKTKTVAWFVSNCETDSRREWLAGNLSHFIPLCHLLSDAKTEVKTYPDISTWWAGNVTNPTCFPPPKSLV
uniref:Fucosyltransferase N-terminal domain-containing protein n=1 Tax=Daphnia galeata TaxID=27404 RepID=A0A8J2W4A6_9CRUS|nr:unnamed protein product [Daphnia galeata]